MLSIIIAAGLMLTSCEAEEIMIEPTTTHVIGVPLWGDGVTEMGDNSFSAVVDGVEFVYDDLEVIVDSALDVEIRLDLIAKDTEGENVFQVILPVITLTEGAHILTYTPTDAYWVSYLNDGEDIFRPTNDAGNVLTIIEFDVIERFVKGDFSTKMQTEAGAPYLDDVTGEFEFFY
jgi:hypothetical protein